MRFIFFLVERRKVLNIRVKRRFFFFVLCFSFLRWLRVFFNFE